MFIISRVISPFNTLSKASAIAFVMFAYDELTLILFFEKKRVSLAFPGGSTSLLRLCRGRRTLVFYSFRVLNSSAFFFVASGPVSRIAAVLSCKFHLLCLEKLPYCLLRRLSYLVVLPFFMSLFYGPRLSFGVYRGFLPLYND